MMNTQEYSFWNLVSLYKIEIPAIQRDYAQGRKNEEKIAVDLVQDLFNILISDNAEKINLHFIYGKIDDHNLIPLDGQQRLTTLFLIHWFLSIGHLSENNKNILSKFTYETRPSSQDFCFKLIKEDFEYDKDEKISVQLRNAKWFFLSWMNDPTVSAMLNMLDTIQIIFSRPESNLFKKLIGEECPILFHFLPLERFKLDDKIYVKMNSRGKPLTEFENFKANFSVLFDFSYRSKLDNEWLDIFWSFERDKSFINISEVDKKYLNFIRNATLNFYTEATDIDKYTRDHFDIFEKYKSVYSTKNDSLQNLCKVFDALTDFSDDQQYFNDFTSDDPDYGERLIFYAVMQFFIVKGNVTAQNKETYQIWIRVCTNLINNTLIQSPESFYRTLRSLKNLSRNIEYLYEYLSKPDTKIEGFSQKQVEEEKRKAQLILTDPSWKPAIYDAEDHDYFTGQIGFILEYSKVGEVFDLELFKDYSAKLKILFGEEFKMKHNCLFQRALLTIGDYLIKINNCRTFCTFNTSLREKMDNWRKVFDDRNNTLMLKGLLDLLEVKTILNGLRKIVDNHEGNDWKNLIIKNKGILEYCDKFRIAKWNNKIALSRSDTDNWRRHADLYSFVLFNKLKEENQGVYYIDSSDDIPWIRIRWKEKLYYVQEEEMDYSFGFCEGNDDRTGLKEMEDYIRELIDFNNLKKEILA